MTFVGLFLLGLALAGLFDWVTACSMNVYRLPTQAARRQAMLVAFAFHGPFIGLALPLFLGGLIAQTLVGLGMRPELAGFASLPVMGVIAAAAIWLVGLLPPVRLAKASLGSLMAGANTDWNRKFGRALGLSPEKSR